MEKQSGFDVDFAWRLSPKRAQRRIDEWNEPALEMGSLYAAQDLGEPEFEGRFRVRCVENARIINAQASPVLFERGASELAYGSERLHVKLQVAGEALVNYGGREIHLKPGDIVLKDTSVPTQMRMSGAWRQSYLSVDKAVVDRLFPEGRPADGTVVRQGAGIGDLASAYLHSLAENAGDLSGQAAQAAIRHVCQLVSLAQAGARAAEREGLRDGVRAARLRGPSTTSSSIWRMRR